MIICVRVQPLYGPTCSPYSYCTATLPYIFLCWLAPVTINSVPPLYSTGGDRTVAVRGHRGTVGQLYVDTVDHKRTSRPVEADFRISLTVSMCDMMKKYAPVPDFKIVCSRHR